MFSCRARLAILSAWTVWPPSLVRIGVVEVDDLNVVTECGSSQQGRLSDGTGTLQRDHRSFGHSVGDHLCQAALHQARERAFHGMKSTCFPELEGVFFRNSRVSASETRAIGPCDATASPSGSEANALDKTRERSHVRPGMGLGVGEDFGPILAHGDDGPSLGSAHFDNVLAVVKGGGHTPGRGSRPRRFSQFGLSNSAARHSMAFRECSAVDGRSAGRRDRPSRRRRGCWRRRIRYTSVY